MRSFLALATAAALAGRAAADLNITVPGMGHVATAQFNVVSNQDLTSNCAPKCDPATAAIKGCSDDGTCLCNSNTTTAVTQCQQCYFERLIHLNMKAPAPNAGSTPALGAYAAACANLATTKLAMALVPPPEFVGPTDIILNTPATVAVVSIGAMLGAGALYIFSSL